MLNAMGFKPTEKIKINTTFNIHDLPGRKFIDLAVELTDGDKVQAQLMAALPDAAEMQDAILRLVVSYPRDWEALIDEPAVRRAAQDAFEFHFIKRPRVQVRLRLAGGKSIASLKPEELISLYWKTVPPAEETTKALDDLAGEIIHTAEMGGAAVEPELPL